MARAEPQLRGGSRVIAIVGVTASGTPVADSTVFPTVGSLRPTTAISSFNHLIPEPEEQPRDVRDYLSRSWTLAVPALSSRRSACSWTLHACKNSRSSLLVVVAADLVWTAAR